MKTRLLSLLIALIGATLALAFFGFALSALAAAPPEIGELAAADDAIQMAAEPWSRPLAANSRAVEQPVATSAVTLSVSIAADPLRPAWGEMVTYTIVMRNAGDASAADALMTNMLPEGLHYVEGTVQATAGAPQYLAAERTIRWDGDLTANAAVTLTYAARLLTQDYIYNTAVLTHPLAAEAADATSSPADEWGAAEVIAEEHVFDYKLASYRNIAVDSQGRPRIAYGGESGLYYATFDNGAWSSIHVPVTPTRPTKAALALDPQDRALIAFYDDIWGYVWLARELGPAVTSSAQEVSAAASAWSLERVSTKAFGSNFTEQADIQLDSAGRLHMAYYDGDTPKGHYYTVYDGGAWSAPALAVASSTCAFAVDAANVPHLACKETAYLRLYTYTGVSPWSSFEQVATGLDDRAIYAPSLVYEGATPHVAFLRKNNGLYHATKSGSWTTVQVDASPWNSGVLENTPMVSATAIRDGRIAIAYAWRWYPVGSSTHTETIRLAVRPLAGDAWIVESADEVVDVSWSQDWARPALALAADGRAHLAYYYAPNQTLRHAAQTGSFTHYTVDESLELGDNTALDVGSDGSIHVAYPANGVRHAVSFSNTTTWTKTVAAPGVGPTALIDIALDAANTPHIVYQEMPLLPLSHAVRSGAGWTIRTVDTPGTEANPSLDADAVGTAHVAYLAMEGTNLAVRHAAFDGSAWTTEMLAVAGPNQLAHSQSPRLIAQNGKVYVLYADCSAYQASGDYPIRLVLKAFAAGAWSEQTLPSFTGQCNQRLVYHLLGDSAGRLAAVAVIADAEGNEQELTFWPAEGGAARLTTRAAPQATSQAAQYWLGYGYRQVRGDGLETLYVSGGQKVAVYQDRSGATSTPVNLAQTLDAATALQDLACYGQTAAALERSYSQNALAVERARPKPKPTEWANAVKAAAPAAVYAYERITYTIRLQWQGPRTAAIVLQEDDLFPEPTPQAELVYVPNSLAWGSYIASCMYSPDQRQITCQGEFPPSSVLPVETSVTFAVTPTCRVYEGGSPYEKVSQVGIGGYYFAPAATMPLKAPLELRASTPYFLPQHHFQPYHTALLYTVPKDDAPDLLLQNCRFDAYTSDNGLAEMRMYNDGQNPDFHANDWHHSQWADLVNIVNRSLTLYVVSAGRSFDKALRSDTLDIPHILPEDLFLVVATDFQAMFNEWNEIGKLYEQEDSRRNAHIADADENRILDYYDAVERIYQYAAAASHPGVVIDVAQEAYLKAGSLDYYRSYADRDRMGKLIDQMLLRLPELPVPNLAIIGNDAVLPYRRVPIPKLAYSEVKYSQEMINPNIPAIQDMGAGGSKGSWLSDIPYGDRQTDLPADGARLTDWAVGRIFADRPLELKALIDALERPIVIRPASSSAWLIGDKNDEQVNFVDGMVTLFVPEFKRYYGQGWLQLVWDKPEWRPTLYPKGFAYWLDRNVKLLDTRNRPRPKNPQHWSSDDVAAVAKQADLLLFLTHASLDGFGGSADRPTLAGGTYRLAMGNACHAGLLPGARGHQAAQWELWWPARGALDSGAPMFAPTSYYLAAKGTAGALYTYAETAVKYHHALARSVMRELLNTEYRFLGAAFRASHASYDCGVYCGDQDAQALYTYQLIGLPTQIVSFRGAQPAGVASVSALDRPSVLQEPSDNGVINRSLVIPYFDEVRDEQGRVAFQIPHNGALGGQAFGPLWPQVQHTYRLPLDAADINVTFTFSQSHPYPQAVDMIPVTPLSFSLEPLSGTLTLAQPYPPAVLDYRVYTDANRLRLDVRLIPFQYDPAARTARLYDRIDYRIAYNAPATYTVAAITVNDGAAVPVDQTALPIAITLNATEPFSGALSWEIMDAAGAALYRGETPLDITAGERQVALNAAVGGWPPGPKQIVIGLAAGATAAEGVTVAAGHALFTVAGHSLALATDKVAYGAGDAAAILTAIVRDQTGATVAGQAANLTTRLDGAAQALAWQGSGVYTAGLNLTAVITGQHFISVTLGNRVAEAAFIVDRQPPTSTLSGPAVLTAPAFTVTLGGDDDLSGVAEYLVQYRIGAGGAWMDWLTRPTGWDYSAGGPADLTLTFGSTEPVAWQPGQTVYFRTRAVDLAGNWEVEHAAADLAVKYEGEQKLYLPLVMRQ